MLNVIVFGAPGSGKGTQSEKLINQYGLHHISTGEVLRHHIANGTELGKIADTYISKGQLIPDDLMVRVLAHVLDNNPEKTAKGVIFDGFPRTIPQALELKKMLAERNTSVNAVIGLEVSEDDLIQRMLRRGIGTCRRQHRHNQKTTRRLPQPDFSAAGILPQRRPVHPRRRKPKRRRNIRRYKITSRQTAGLTAAKHQTY